MVTTFGLLTLDTLTDLRAAPTQDGQLVLVLGALTYGDGLGGFYRWSDNITPAEDATYYNVIAATGSATGRWIRVFQRVRTVGANVLVANGSFKQLYCPGVTDSNGRVTLYLTDDGTANGNALFSTIMQTAGEGTDAVTQPNAALVGSRYSVSVDRKTLVYQFSRGSTTTLGALGLTILGLVAAPSGANVTVRIDGM